MKLFRIGLIVLTLGSLLFLSLSCRSSNTSTATTGTSISTVKKGTILTSVVGTGNLAYSDTEKLAFDMASYVQEVLVSAGDTVKKDQELVKLDTSEWKDQIKSLESKLTAAQRNLVTAQRQVGAKQLAVTQADLNLQTAQYNLSKLDPVKTAQDEIDEIEYSIDFAENMVRVPDEDMSYWRDRIDTLEIKLKEAQKDLKDVLSGNGINISTTVALQIAEDQLQIEQSTRAIEDAQLAITNAQLDQTDAESAVKDAQEALDEANSLSPIVKAPFDGYITKVNVSGGDDIQKGTVAVEIADPNKFEAKILVTENDIYSVKMGGDATVSFDALSGLNYSARISKIAPLATVSQGVVNYSVTAELTSTTPIINRPGTIQNFNQSSSGQSATSNTPSNINRQGGFPTGTPPAGAFPPGGSSGNNSGQSPPSGNTSPLTISLRDGLSATVTIIIQQKDNVLMVPNRAITRSGGVSTVLVVKGATNESRTVKTGLSDASNTEITDGLFEGEQVIVKTSSTSNSNSFGPPPGAGGFMIR